MSFNVGIPFMKCSIHPSRTVNPQTGKKAKAHGLGATWREMNNQRIGRDKSIDRTLTKNNVWMVGSTDDDIEGIVQSEIDRINDIRHKAGVRALREDCVSVMSLVEKPSIKYMETLTYDQKKRFLEDSHKIMTELLHEWRPDWEILAAVQHHDEFGGISPHTHTLVLLRSHTDDGVETLRARNEITNTFFKFINKEYPKRMKELGYDVSECRMKEDLTEEEKAVLEKYPAGRDALTYKHDKLKALEAELKEKENEILEITAAPSLKEYAEVVSENKRLTEEISIKDKLIEELKRFKKQAETIIIKFYEVVQKAGLKLMKCLGLDETELSQLFENGNKSQEIMDYPSGSVLKGFKSMSDSLSKEASCKYTVIPDDITKDMFRIVYHDESGKCITVKRGFSNRDIAEKHCRNLVLATRAVTETIKKTWDD